MQAILSKLVEPSKVQALSSTSGLYMQNITKEYHTHLALCLIIQLNYLYLHVIVE